MPASEKTLQNLIVSIGQLQDEVKDLTDSEELRTLAENRRRKAFWAVVIGIITASILAIGAVILAIVSLVALDGFRDERSQRSINSCLQENRGLRSGMLDVASFIEASVGPSGRNPDGTLSEGNERFIGLLRDRFRLRDCTPEGVEQYLSELAEG